MTFFYDPKPVKNLLLLVLLAGCGHGPAAHEILAKPAEPTYASGDRATTGPLDTLHVGRGLVLRLIPGSKSDFPPATQQYASFPEVRFNGR